MPGTNISYGQMYDHELNPRKGWSGDRGMALEKVLPIDSSETDVAYAGMGVTIHKDNNTFLVGQQTETTTQFYPPLFVFQNAGDFDVNPDFGNIAGGVIMALSCLGNFELESTAGALNQTFVAGTPIKIGATDGLLYAATLSTDTICGIVSEKGPNSASASSTAGSFTNEYGKQFVRFWTCYLPKGVSGAS